MKKNEKSSKNSKTFRELPPRPKLRRRLLSAATAVLLAAVLMSFFAAAAESDPLTASSSILQSDSSAATPVGDEPHSSSSPVLDSKTDSSESAPFQVSADISISVDTGSVPLSTASPTGQGTPLDATHFPDAAFLSCVRAFDLNGDGMLSDEECAAVTNLDIRNRGIRSLQGIDVFTELTNLNCIGNELTELPLEHLSKLTNLLCNENQLTSLDLSQTPALVSLHCHDNQLTTLDVSVLPNLQELACGHNLFESLDLSRNAQLAYFLYLGGPLKTLTLSRNDSLLHLFCSYSLVTELDLSQAPNLEQLGIDRSDLTFLDLSGNPHLTDVLAGDNQLLSIRMGASVPGSINLDAQRPVTIQIGAQETTFDLTRLGIPLDPTCISDLTGAELNGSVLSGLSDQSTVTYRYTDGSVSFNATLMFQVSNAWLEPLTLEDWTYGQAAHTPHADAQYGQPVYQYSSTADGVFSSTVPTNAGTWYVKAVVPPSDGHAGLTDIAEFHIWKAQPDYSIPAGLTAVYGDLLSDIDPGEGFVWEAPDQAVGNAGQRTFRARFIPADTQNYLVVRDVKIPVRITPKPASRLWVSEVNNAQEADRLTVLDGTKQLYQDVDYLLSSQQSGGRVILTLTFQGNYTGVVTRSYPIPGSGGSPAPDPTVPSVPVTHPPVNSPTPSPSASSSQETSESSPGAKPASSPIPGSSSYPSSGSSSEVPVSEVEAASHGWFWWLLLLLVFALSSIYLVLHPKEGTEQ